MYVDGGDKTIEHDCKVSFKPKRFSSDFLLVEETQQRKSAWNNCCRKNDILTPDLLKNYVQEILRYCLTHRVDTYRIHIDRLKGAKLITKVAHRTNYNDLTIIQTVGIIWSSLSVVHHFHMQIKPIMGCKAWIRRRQYRYAIYAYEMVLNMLLPHMFNTVIQALVTFFNEAKIWDLESLVTMLIKQILDIYKDNGHVVNNLLDIVQGNENIMEVKNILRVLVNLLKVLKWADIEIPLLKRVLDQYYQTITDEDFSCLNPLYDSCIRHMFKNIPRRCILKGIQMMIGWTSELDNDGLVTLGNMLEYVASLKNKVTLDLSITGEVMTLVVEMISSEDIFLSLLGCRILTMMLDRNANNIVLMTPKIYFKEIPTGICFNICDIRDRRFLQTFHDTLHSSLLQALVQHGMVKVNLECIFAILATLTVEVPCGYTAASIVCLLMAIQEYALDQYKVITTDHSNRIHGCVMYVMSLVCFIHRAEIFFEYVNTVMSRRAQFAPQLNPPIRLYYPASETVHLRKAELYFEDWEARYGLWKCFISSAEKAHAVD